MFNAFIIYMNLRSVSSLISSCHSFDRSGWQILKHCGYLYNVYLSAIIFTFHHIILPNVMGGAVSVTRPPSPTASVLTTVPCPHTAGDTAITPAGPG